MNPTYEYRTLTFDIGSSHHASAAHMDWLNENCARWEIINSRSERDGIDYTMRRFKLDTEDPPPSEGVAAMRERANERDDL